MHFFRPFVNGSGVEILNPNIDVSLVLVIATYMLGGSLCAESVINCSLRRVILIDTSRAYTRARNHTAMLIVVKTFHGNLILTVTSGVHTWERNHTLCCLW